MFCARLLAAASLLGACAAFAAAPAGAARPGLGFPSTITTTHFMIHYDSSIIDAQAGDLGANAEKAYALYTGWGYPAPTDDGDGHIDVWVESLAGTGAVGFAEQDTVGAAPTSGWIAIDPTVVESEHVIAHELFHLVQYGLWTPPDDWMLEGSAEWTGFAADSYDPAGAGATKLAYTLASPDMSLDCITMSCGTTPYDNGGYSRWSFFQYLAEKYGNAFMGSVFQAGATLGNPLATSVTILDNALQGKGTTLSDTYSAYTNTVVSGSFTTTALKGLPPTVYQTIPGGTTTAVLPVTRVAVNHLAARYLDFTRGTSGSTTPCFAATLALTIALPAGIGSKPALYSSSLGASAIPLSISGTTASLSVPWDTCAGGPDGYLSLPNPSLASDSQVFTISGSVTVDLNTPATPTAPPAAIFTGTTVAAPTTDLAPSIFVYGAAVIRVSTTDRIVRLIVFSSGPGMLQAVVGKTNLGTYQLRPGNNDVRFKLPASLANSLRVTKGQTSGGGVLTLTAVSSAGTAGTVVSRKLTIVKPHAPKPTTH